MLQVDDLSAADFCTVPAQCAVSLNRCKAPAVSCTLAVGGAGLLLAWGLLKDSACLGRRYSANLGCAVLCGSDLIIALLYR